MCIRDSSLFVPSLRAAQAAPAANTPKSSAAVTVTDNGRSWTLDNGIVKATITKDSGSMPSLLYHGVQIMAASGGTWEHTPQGAPQVTNSISIDPATNGGVRAEVSIKGISGGTHMMTPGAPGGGTLCEDVYKRQSRFRARRLKGLAEPEGR